MILYLIIMLFITKVFMVSIYDDKIPLVELDAMILKLMKNCEENKGEHLYKHAFNYFNLLDDIEILLKNPTKRQRGLKKFYDVNANGGPNFVNAKFSMDDFRDIYEWDNNEITEFKAIIEGTEMLWAKLTNMVSEIESKLPADKVSTT
uniref:Uncharacterized protein n=1 Tax=Clastoptera arizonana TaxID=38151 RepID=A0A1B6CSG1_9HEMI